MSKEKKFSFIKHFFTLCIWTCTRMERRQYKSKSI